MNTRQRWLALALTVTLAAAFWPGGEDSDEVVETVPRENRTTRPLVSAPKALDGAPQPAAPAGPERVARMQADLFPSQTWVPPPPPPKPYVPPPPPPPQPPPLPFKYLGRWVDDGEETLFLVQGEQPIPAAVGEVLPGNWRVDQINAGTVVFTYLPLNMQSTLGFTP